MGLDQYLYVEKYVSRTTDKKIKGSAYDYETNELFNTIVSTLNAETLIDGSHSGITVSFPVGYWRKVNSIHGWITNKCANGVDECQQVHISREQAEELISDCKSVIADTSLANELLPPVYGSFFGTYEIDEYYVGELKRTVEILEKVLSDKDTDYLIYQASW